MIDQSLLTVTARAAETVKTAGKSFRQTIQKKRDPLALALAFAAVYFFWGSTYLAISLAIETTPPFLMASARFTTGGAVLYAWAWSRGAPHPSAVHWRTAAITGGLMLLGGNGVVWAEQFVPSGQAAVLVSTVPLWVVVGGAVALLTHHSGKKALLAQSCKSPRTQLLARNTLLRAPWRADISDGARIGSHERHQPAGLLGNHLQAG